MARRVLSITSPATGAAAGPLVTGFTYDPDGRVLQTQQSAGGTVLRTTRSSYTLTGQAATATDANGHVTRYAYDSVDRLASVTDPVYNVTSYAYDAMSRRTGIFNLAIQMGALQQQSYTPDGLVESLTDANGNATSFGYDGLDRLATTTYPGGSTQTLSYDNDNNVLSRVTRKGDTISFSYDTLNRLCSKAIAASPTSCSATSSGNPTVWYSYDLAGRPTGFTDNSASVAGVSASARYATSYSYDALNRPSGASWDNAPAQTAPTASSVTFDLGYDAGNRRIGHTATDDSWWSVPSSPSSTNYTANALNQYSAVGAVTPAYDGNGNLTYDGSFTYCYDAESRLTGVVTGTCASPATTVATYAYDAQGRRKSKTVAGVTTIYVTDADNREVLEYNGSTGAIQAWYAYGLGLDEPLNRMNVTGSTRQTLIPDVQGSVIGTLDSSGALAKTGYQTYGENPSLSSGNYQYTARRFDAETAGSTYEPSGLYYYRARMYSPALGRFLQPDPIGYAAGTNLYAYVNNDPLNATDPDGMGRIGWIVNLTKSGFQYLRPLFEKADAVAARQAGKNVVLENGTQQQAVAIERAANQGANDTILTHAGHELEDRSFGISHAQTEGKSGHTFYDIGASIIGGTLTALDVLDQLDPTYIGSVGCGKGEQCGFVAPTTQDVQSPVGDTSTLHIQPNSVAKLK